MGETETVFNTSPQTGLTAAEVAERVAAGKVNGEQTVRTKSVADILRSNILTFFNFVFIVLAVLLAGFVPDGMDGIGNFGFLILIVFNTLVGIIQELRAKRTMDRLSLLSAPKALVIRDGEEKEIPLEEIVLDDITELAAGRQVCADGVVVEGSCEVNESLITGEPDAIVKNVGDKVMSGSFVVSGRARCRVEHIGADNFVMKISKGAKYFKKPTSEIWRSLMLIVKVMSIVIVPLGIALFCSKYFRDPSQLNDTVLTTIGSVIGMIPSGLVALASTVFCVSVIRLSRHKTIAQDLYCVETLARVDVLCLDKTGTITEGSMEVNDIIPRDGLSGEEMKAMLKAVVEGTGDENATAQALAAYLDGVQAIAETERAIPFSSARKWSGVRAGGVSYALGAVEFVLPRNSGEITEKASELAAEGYRVLACVSSKKDFNDTELPGEVVFEGFVIITDKIRKEAPDTLRFFREQGVDVKIISGDNPETVRAVAKRAGLEKCDEIIDMSTLSTEEEIREAATRYTIFGRVLPDQKLLLVKALKAAGHTVAMTGDGVNDVLALKEADCSVAMASGSDAAKNVSSLVLMDSNFASMPRIVAEGRRSINNLERSASLYIMNRAPLHDSQPAPPLRAAQPHPHRRRDDRHALHRPRPRAQQRPRQRPLPHQGTVPRRAGRNRGVARRLRVARRRRVLPAGHAGAAPHHVLHSHHLRGAHLPLPHSFAPHNHSLRGVRRDGGNLCGVLPHRHSAHRRLLRRQQRHHGGDGQGDGVDMRRAHRDLRHGWFTRGLHSKIDAALNLKLPKKVAV